MPRPSAGREGGCVFRHLPQDYPDQRPRVYDVGHYGGRREGKETAMGNRLHEMPSRKELSLEDRQTFDLWLAAQPEYVAALKAKDAADVALNLLVPGPDARVFLQNRRGAQAAVEAAAKQVKDVRKKLERQFGDETKGLWNN
jgi:hypothetical protein